MKNISRVLVIITFSISVFSCTQRTHLQKVNVIDFGAIPDDGQNDIASLREAVVYCKSNPGTTLYFPPGVYNFKDEKAVELMNSVLNGQIKGNPSDSIFRPHYPYVKGLNFDGVKNIIVEANGATLLCEGWMEPISLNNCVNVSINGLTIDYKRKPYSLGKIVKVQDEWFDVEFSDQYPVSANIPLCRLHIWDIKSHRMILQDLDYFPRHEIIAPQTLRIYCKHSQDIEGKMITIAHSLHFRPAILLLESKNIEIKDVTIHSQPGMGILGHRSENITLSGTRIVPNAGQLMSTNTDASHFTSCKGFIRYENCLFEGQGDDAINIHNYYLTIKSANGKGYNLVSEAKLHAQVLDYPDVGDTLELASKSNLEVVKKVVVRSRENNTEELYSHVTLNEELPSDIENYYLINITRLPRVEITGCVVTSNRARGFLIKARNVLIEHNMIRESTGTGIHIGTEGNWHEGPLSENVIIRYNSIIRCGTGAGTIEGSCGIAINVNAPNKSSLGLHKNITIEGNIIEGESAKTGIYASNVEGLNILYNEITGCTYPVKIENSTHVELSTNSVIKN